MEKRTMPMESSYFKPSESTSLVFAFSVVNLYASNFSGKVAHCGVQVNLMTSNGSFQTSGLRGANLLSTSKFI